MGANPLRYSFNIGNKQHSGKTISEVQVILIPYVNELNRTFQRIYATVEELHKNRTWADKVSNLMNPLTEKSGRWEKNLNKIKSQLDYAQKCINNGDISWALQILDKNSTLLRNITYEIKEYIKFGISGAQDVFVPIL
jgi:hypothetical protein